MAFNDNDDDVDYDQLKRDRANERADLSMIKDSFKLNIGNDADKFIALLKGDYHAPSLPGEPDRITRPIKDAEKFERGRTASWEGDDRDYNDRDREPRYRPRRDGRIERPIDEEDDYEPQQQRRGSSRVPAKYAEVLEALDRFKFSDDENRLRKQMSVVAGGIRNALQELILEDVATNTRTAFGEYVEHIYKVAGGVKVIYKFNDEHCTVIAKGVFFGDESICVHAKGGKVVAGVYRIDGDNSSNLTANFDITVSK
jgi:hypothetical protein